MRIVQSGTTKEDLLAAKQTAATLDQVATRNADQGSIDPDGAVNPVLVGALTRYSPVVSMMVISASTTRDPATRDD